MLYYKKESEFASLFSSFEEKEVVDMNVEDKYNALIITEKNSKIMPYKYQIHCDVNMDNWFYKLMDELGEWYTEYINCTVIHGSCVRMYGKNVLFVGARKNGKTTLITYLIHKHNAEYLDDDAIFMLEGAFIGFNMPIALRNDVDGVVTNTDVQNVFDGEIIRTLYKAPNKISMVSDIDFIIFPRFNKQAPKRIREIENNKAFDFILENIRHSKNTQQLFCDVVKLARHRNIYEIVYSNSVDANDLVCSLITAK